MTGRDIKENWGTQVAEFNFWVGKYMDKFYDNLINKKIVGNKCPKCSKVFVPPRKICNKCKKIIELDQNWVDLPETGTLINYTMTPYRVSQEGKIKEKELLSIGMMQIDGSNTSIMGKLLNIEPENIKQGMKLKIEWAKETLGAPSDIEGFIKV